MAKKIKIAFFSPSSHSFFFPKSKIKYGGAELQMFLLAKAISNNQNFNINFFTSNEGQSKVELYQNIKLLKSIRLLQYENIFNKIIKSLKLFFLLKKHKPTVIITTTANSIVGIISFYSKILNIKHIHRTAHQKDVDYSWIKTNGIKGKFYKYGLENANKITVQSSDYQKLLQKTHSLNPEILKNGFIINPTSLFTKKEILWVGRFKEWKRPRLFIKLASYFKNEHFIMICPYTTKHKEEWLKLKLSAEKYSNISFIEKIPFNKIQPYFNNAKLFVNTSDSEGYPNTFLQAAQGQTPIISLNVNPDNFITKYNCGIFCNNDFETMVLETKKILKNKHDLILKGENAFQYLKENHDINNIGKQLEKIIKSVL